MNKSKILVMLSTYNGEKFLKDQLDSIIHQKNVEVHILVRDDGSGDRTVEIIQAYQQHYNNISFIEGENIGSCKSFFELIKAAPNHYDFYSFADQDDVWLDQKLYAAANMLRDVSYNQPVLYCSNVSTVDSELNPVDSVFIKNNVKPSFGNAIIENIATGNTIVINHTMMQNIKNHIPAECYMHDWWLYIVAAYFGRIIFDYRSFILYRQHENNVIGIPQNRFDLLRKRLVDFRNRRYRCSQQMLSFKNAYSHELIDGENNRLIQLVIQSRKSISARFRLMTDQKIYRSCLKDTVLYKINILIEGC